MIREERILTVMCVIVLISAGRRQDHGQGFGPHAALRQEVHHDESQHPGRQSKDTDAQVQQQHGTGDERRHQSHGHHEQTGLLKKKKEKSLKYAIEGK